MHHRHHRTPLRVPILATIVAILVSFLFGGVTRASDETSLQSAATQSANEAQSSVAVTATAATNNEDQSSSDIVATATTTLNNTQSANGGHGCVHQDISPGEVDVSLKTSDGSSSFTAYEAVEFSVSLTLEEGHCAGDSIVISVPEELGTDGSFDPIPMTTPDGVIIGYATYSSDHTVVIKLTSEVEVPGRKDFRASAWWRVHMSSTLVPGETRELRWDIDGVVRRTTIQVGVCDGCSTIGKDPSKWGSVDGSEQHVTIVLPTADRDNQQFVVTDTLTSPGQSFACDRLLTGRIGIYSEAGPWGQPQYTRYADPDVVSCSNSKAVIKVQLNTGEKARFEMNIAVESADPGPWTDAANITSQDKSWDVSARIIRRESGGNAGFTPTPTPSPAPTPTPSTSPTPAPSVTPSATPTPVPTPSASPSPTPTPSPSTSTPVTPTPAPSASPSPSPSAPSPSVTPTPSPSTTPSATPVPTPTSSTTPTPVTTPSTAPSTVPVPTPTPTPSTPPRQFRLPVTGGAGSGAIASAVALLVIGIGAFWARRRQTARYSED